MPKASSKIAYSGGKAEQLARPLRSMAEVEADFRHKRREVLSILSALESSEHAAAPEAQALIRHYRLEAERFGHAARVLHLSSAPAWQAREWRGIDLWAAAWHGCRAARLDRDLMPGARRRLSALFLDDCRKWRHLIASHTLRHPGPVGLFDEGDRP